MDKLQEWWQDNDFIIIPIFVALLIIVSITAGVIKMAEISCERTALVMGVIHSWSFYTGCMVYMDGKWMPLEYWQYREIKINAED